MVAKNIFFCKIVRQGVVHYNFEAIATPAALTLFFQGELKICLCGGSISGFHYLIYGVAILCVDT